jgi:hypothetical protein
MRTEGMKRLGIVVGVLAAVAWVILCAVVSNGFAKVQPLGWIIFIVGVPGSFAAAFLLVRGVDWIIAGFGSATKG